MSPALASSAPRCTDDMLMFIPGKPFLKISDIDGLAKSQRSPRRHAKLDPASIDDRYFYIPACAGMTVIGFLRLIVTINACLWI